MREILNLLVIEDVEADFLLIERHLRLHGLPARCRRVASAEALREALDTEIWSAVLSDFNVPGMDFRDTLAHLRARHPGLPVILISGSVGEEEAVELLKQGVWDFILKDRLARLVPAIERSLREAAEHRALQAAQDALRASEERFQLAMRGANDGLWDWDLKTDAVYYSPRWKSMLGYGEDELPTHLSTWKRLVHPDDLEPTLAAVRDLLEGRSLTFEVEFRMHHKEGHYRHILSRAFLVRSAEGEPMRLVGTHVDITERMRAAQALRESEERLSMALAASQMGVWAWDVQTDTLFWSQECFDIVGAETHTGTVESFRKVLHPEDADRVMAAAMRALEERTPYTAEFRIVRPDGEVRWLSNLARGHYDKNGKPLRLIGTVQDITERRYAAERLRQAATVFTHTQEGVAITDRDRNVIAVNPAFTTITGYTEAEVLGRNLRLLNSGRHDRAFYQSMWRHIKQVGYWQGEMWNRRKNGEIFPEWLTVSTVRDEQGEVVNYVGVFTDITHIKHSEAELEHLAHHDPLTDLPNRLQLLSRLEHAVQRAERGGKRGAVLFLDLDRFKNINDSLGHPAGDELLQIVASRLRERLRDVDTLARLGGDEFVLVLEDLAGPEDAALVGQSLISLLSPPFRLSSGHEVYVGGSVGISLFPDDGDHPDVLIQHADAALYQAKEAGRNTYRFYTQALTAVANERMAMEAALRRGLEQGEFLLHYQPMVTLKNGRAIGVEALVRWQAPGKELISPVRIIPLAEETGLIVPLGEWVLREACTRMKRWLDAGLPFQIMAVNLSPRQFHQADLAERIRAILDETGLPAQHLELEITEGAIMEESRGAEAKLAALKALGVRLAIDDFGTGYSSLAYLKRFPLDKLKIDQSFIRDIPHDRASAEIATTIIAMAKNLNLGVLAEGVETEAQLEFLKGHGCETGQGYLFSRPVAPAVLEEHATT